MAITVTVTGNTDPGTMPTGTRLLNEGDYIHVQGEDHARKISRVFGKPSRGTCHAATKTYGQWPTNFKATIYAAKDVPEKLIRPEFASSIGVEWGTK